MDREAPCCLAGLIQLPFIGTDLADLPARKPLVRSYFSSQGTVANHSRMDPDRRVRPAGWGFQPALKLSICGSTTFPLCRSALQQLIRLDTECLGQPPNDLQACVE